MMFSSVLDLIVMVYGVFVSFKVVVVVKDKIKFKLFSYFKVDIIDICCVEVEINFKVDIVF